MIQNSPSVLYFHCKSVKLINNKMTDQIVTAFIIFTSNLLILDSTQQLYGHRQPSIPHK